MGVHFVDIGKCKKFYHHCLNLFFIIIVNLITIIFLVSRYKWIYRSSFARLWWQNVSIQETRFCKWRASKRTGWINYSGMRIRTGLTHKCWKTHRLN